MVSGWCLDDGMWMEPEELKRVEHRCGDRIWIAWLLLFFFKGWMTLRRTQGTHFSLLPDCFCYHLDLDDWISIIGTRLPWC